MSKKGIVCENKKEYCVFLTPDGQFVRGIPIVANVQIGDEAEFHEYVVISNKRSPVKRAIFPIIAAAAIFMLLFATLLNPTQSVHAYVQVDGIEKVEFGVDENGQVIEVRPLSGNNIELEADLYKGKPVETVIENILSVEVELNEPVSITTVFTNNAGDSNSKKEIEQAISDVQNKFNEKEVTVYEATETDRKEANEKGVAIQQHLNAKKSGSNKPQKDHKPDVKEGPKEKEPKQKPQSPKNPNGDKDNKQNSNNANQQNQHPNGNANKAKNQPADKEKKQKDQQQEKNEGDNDQGKGNKESKENEMDNPDQNNGNGKENGIGKSQGNNNKDKNENGKGNED